MTEAHAPRLDDEHTSTFGITQDIVGIQTVCLQRGEHRIDRVVRCRRDQQDSPAAVRRQARHDGFVHRLQTLPGRERIGEFGRAVALRRREAIGDLDQRQRIAMRRRDETVDDLRVCAGLEQVRRIRGCEACQRQRVEPL